MQMVSDPAANLERACYWVEQAAREGAKIVCLPELFRSQYFCQREAPELFEFAEAIPGPSTVALGKVAKDRKIIVIGSLFERRAAGLYHNTVAIINEFGELAGIYRKMHIPDDPAYYEKYYFTPGDLGFKTFATSMGPIGTLICWDQWYPEAARLTTLQGANVIFYPTAIGWHPHEKEAQGTAQHDAWRTIQRSHAIANGVYIAAVNRVGHEQPLAGSAGIEFWGRSFISDPYGIVIAEASAGEEVIIAEVDLSRQEDVRRNWPFLRDRRIDAYHGIVQRYLDSPEKQR